MTSSRENNLPIDVVIAWVDGNSPKLAEKRNLYLTNSNLQSGHPGALPTHFASINEIKYCLFSILKFAPFVRNVFIVTDEQDPNLWEDIKRYYPERINSVKIVDHKEIFEGYEEYLPVFNSTAIETMIWRIEGLAEHFVYFNDDFILVREHKPEDWFVDNKPVLRGRWEIAPFRKILRNKLKIAIKKHLLKHANYQPRFSFYLGQWNAASMLGKKCRYFFNCHTPYVYRVSTFKKFFNSNPNPLIKNISYRFRNQNQYNLTTLAYHLEIQSGNRNFAKLERAYFHPSQSKNRINRSIAKCENNESIKSICIQSLEMFGKDQQEKIFSLLNRLLGI
jgi:hypothetical protein